MPMGRKTIARHPCQGRSLAQVHAFEAIATGQTPRCAQKTLDALVAGGLVDRLPDRISGHDAFGPIKVPVYQVPVHHHIAWCDWCAEWEDDDG